MGSKFEFPRLSRRDIVTILKRDVSATVEEQDFINPHTDFVSAIFTRLLLSLGSLSEEDAGQIDFDVLENLENPERHIDSCRYMTLSKRVASLMVSLGCPWRFTMKDLVQPETDRTELFIGAILNYSLHRETKMDFMTPAWDELNDIGEQRAELEDKKNQLNSEMAFCVEERERELPMLQEAEAKCNALKQEIHSLNNQQMSLRATYRQLKEQVGEMEEKISNAEFAVVKSAQENANLCSKIVQSPDKLQRTLEEKKSTREEAKNEERLAHQSFRDKTAISELYSAVLKKISKLYAQMEAILEQVNDFKEVEKEFKAGKIKLSNEEVNAMSLEAKRVEKQGIAQKLDDLRKQLEKEKNTKCEEADREVHSMKTLVESKRRELEAQQRNVEAIVAEVDASASQTKSVKESGAAIVQLLIKKSEELATESRRYMQDIDAFLQMLIIEGQ